MQIETLAIDAGKVLDPAQRAPSLHLTMSRTCLPHELTGVAALDEDERAVNDARMAMSRANNAGQ